MGKYQICEDNTTYLLEIDHNAKTFSVGSIKGKVTKPDYVKVDASAYREQIAKIGVDYKFLKLFCKNRLTSKCKRAII